MATIEPYQTKAGKRWRVRYRKPDRSQTDKRGFKTKRDAQLFAATVETSKVTGTYIDPTAGRVTIGTSVNNGSPSSSLCARKPSRFTRPRSTHIYCPRSVTPPWRTSSPQQSGRE